MLDENERKKSHQLLCFISHNIRGKCQVTPMHRGFIFYDAWHHYFKALIKVNPHSHRFSSLDETFNEYQKENAAPPPPPPQN